MLLTVVGALVQLNGVEHGFPAKAVAMAAAVDATLAEAATVYLQQYAFHSHVNRPTPLTLSMPLDI